MAVNPNTTPLPYGELNVGGLVGDMSYGKIVWDTESGRTFFVPKMIVAGDENGIPTLGNYAFDPETGNAIEETAVVKRTELGHHIVVAADAVITGAVIYDNVMVRDQATIRAGVKIENDVVIGRKTSIRHDCIVEAGANISSRCVLEPWVHVEAGVDVMPRQRFPERTRVTKNTRQRIPEGPRTTAATQDRPITVVPGSKARKHQ